MSIEIKIIAALAAVIGALAAVWFLIGSAYDKGYAAGENYIQRQFDTYKLVQEDATEKILIAQKEHDAQVHNQNDAIVSNLQTQLDSAHDAAQLYDRRLQSALAATSACSNALSRTANKPRVVATPAASSEGQIAEAVAARLAECDSNEVRMTGLQLEIMDQLKPH